MDSFAVVYLIDAKKHIVVPENHIFDLNQAKLKNIGVNRNQNFKIFWSSQTNSMPNFNSNRSYIFPPATDEACYIGRIYKFFSKCFASFFLITVRIKHFN